MKRKTKHNLKEVQKREKEKEEQSMKKETELLIALNKEVK